MTDLQVEIFGDDNITRLKKNINEFLKDKGKHVVKINFNSQVLDKNSCFMTAFVVYQAKDKDD